MKTTSRKSHGTNRIPLARASLACGLRSRICLRALVAATLTLHILYAGGQQPRPTSSPAVTAGGRRYVEGELLVKLLDRPAKAQIAPSPHGSIGATVLRRFPAIGWEHVRLPAGMSVSDGIKAYLALPGVL